MNPTPPVPSAAAMQCAEETVGQFHEICSSEHILDAARKIDQAIATAVSAATKELVEASTRLAKAAGAIAYYAPIDRGLAVTGDREIYRLREALKDVELLLKLREADPIQATDAHRTGR